MKGENPMPKNIRGLLSAVAVICSARRHILCCGVLLLLTTASVLPCMAAQNEFELYPTWVRPGPETIVRVKLSDTFDVTKKMYLRLILPKSTVADFPLPVEQVHRRLAEVKIPGPLRRGTYKSELVSDEGVVLASGMRDVKVAATEKPVITSILPKVIYPQNGRYNFDIIGENFSHVEEEKIVIRINDIALADIKKCESVAGVKTPDLHNEHNLPCLVSDWRAIRMYGLSLDAVSIGRPLEISVEVDKLISDPKPLALSLVQRFTPIVVALAVLAAVVAVIYFLFIRKMLSRQPRKTQYPLLACLVIEPQTKTYSLAKLQMLIWASAAIVSYSYLAASQFLVQWKLGIPNVPEGLPMLLGISATTTALAVSATELRGSKGAGLVNPGLADFITTGGVFAPERLQFFVWTILGAITFVAATLAQDPGTATEMARIPDTFNQLMGASSLGYLAGKFTRKPGPVINAVTIDEQSGAIRISGESLSPRAQIQVNGAPSAYPVDFDLCQAAGTEFFSELSLMPGKEVPEVPQVTHVKVKNPDGQIAEWHSTPPSEDPALKGQNASPA